MTFHLRKHHSAGASQTKGGLDQGPKVPIGEQGPRPTRSPSSKDGPHASGSRHAVSADAYRALGKKGSREWPRSQPAWS
eukprot:3599511-Alexandrium_andersonii.AAC.1